MQGVRAEIQLKAALTRRLVKVGLEDMLVKDQQGLENLPGVFIGNRLPDLEQQVAIRKRLFRLESLKGQGRGQLGSFIGRRVVSHGKVDVQCPNQFRVALNHVSDEVPSKSLVSQPGSNVLQSLGMGRVVLVQNVLEREVTAAQTVAKVLSKDPTDIGVRCFLHGVMRIGVVDTSGEERVLGHAVQQRGLLDDLVNRVLDGRRLGVGHRVQVHRNDGDTVGKLLDVLSSRVETVKVVEITEGREELSGTAHLVSNNNSSLSGFLDFEQLDDGTASPDDLVHDALVDFQRVVACLFQERSIRHGSNVDKLVVRVHVVFQGFGCILGEDASSNKVAPDLLGRRGRNGAC